MTATIVRKFDHWSYPRNGNLHNPTPYFRWFAYVDGVRVNGGDSTLAKAKAFLAEYYGHTTPTVVRDELPANPYSQSLR